MSGRRDRGTNIITAEERNRRAQEAKAHIRETATYTPTLLGRVESRIDANAFRRCISDNTIYQSLCNSLKDKNLPERERHPDLVDFLALEAIIPVNYDGEYNRVLKDLFIRCHTEAWVDKAVLEANHIWFEDQINEAKHFIRAMINKVDSQLLEIILEDIETNFWREKIQDNILYQKVYAKIIADRDLTQRDVLTVIALNGGKYPTEIFRHLVVNQSSAMLDYGSNIQAQHALYDDNEYKDTVDNNNPVVDDALIELESLADAMHNKHKSREMRKKIQEMKNLMKDDIGVIRATQGSRVRKTPAPAGFRLRPAGSSGPAGLRGASRAPSRLGSHASEAPALFVGDRDGGFGGGSEYDGYGGHGHRGQRDQDDVFGLDAGGGVGTSGSNIVKREEPNSPGSAFFDRSDSLARR